MSQLSLLYVGVMLADMIMSLTRIFKFITNTVYFFTGFHGNYICTGRFTKRSSFCD